MTAMERYIRRLKYAAKRKGRGEIMSTKSKPVKVKITRAEHMICSGPCTAGLMPGESCEDCGKVADIADMMQGQGGCTG